MLANNYLKLENGIIVNLFALKIPRIHNILKFERKADPVLQFLS